LSDVRQGITTLSLNSRTFCACYFSMFLAFNTWQLFGVCRTVKVEEVTEEKAEEEGAMEAPPSKKKKKKAKEAPPPKESSSEEGSDEMEE